MKKHHLDKYLKKSTSKATLFEDYAKNKAHPVARRTAAFQIAQRIRAAHATKENLMIFCGGVYGIATILYQLI